MSFYTTVFHNEDETWGAALRAVGGPFNDDEGGIDYEESTVLLAFGSTAEAALLQLRAMLNAAIGAVELDILTRRKVRDMADDVSEMMRVWAEDDDIVDAPEDTEDDEEDNGGD